MNITDPFTEIAQQVQNNSTGWVGKLPGQEEHLLKGQTFVAPSSGDLMAIEVFSNLVAQHGKLSMTLHRFDKGSRNWGDSIGSAVLDLENTDAGKWIAFPMQGTHLDKGESYGFLLDSVDSYVGLGEACTSANQNAFRAGQEWGFSSHDPQGHAFSYLSLAFRVAVAA